MVDTPRAHEQQLPLRNARTSVQDELIADISARRDIGIATYGTALQPFNGRDAGRDLVEELLDAAVYAKQLAIENRDLRTVLAEIFRRASDEEGQSYPFVDDLTIAEIMESHGVYL